LEKMVDNRFFVVWSELISKGLRQGDGYLIAADLPAHKASNELARRFLQTPCDTLFMLDSDADIGPAFLHEFRDFAPGWEYDVLQAFYVRRGWPPQPIWMRESNEAGAMTVPVLTDECTEDVAAIGTHAVLIRRHVLEGMATGKDPHTFEWFFYPPHTKTSEDIAFSVAAREAGYRLGATTAVKAGHISRVTTGWQTYQEYVGLNR
jgi:hypothetical protein